jgi:hypothetical protein
MQATTTTAQPTTNTADLVAPLHPSAHALFNLTPAERATCRVFAFPSCWLADEDVNRPVAVVCQLVPRAQWAQLMPNQVLLFTELFQHEDEDEPAQRSLVTHVGPLNVFDARRGLFYADSWTQGCIGLDIAADDLQEVWAVQRLIPANL